MTDYQITVSKEQASLIQDALEIYSRLSSGQVGIALDIAYNFKLSWDQKRQAENLVKPIVFPELSRNAYYGVGCKESPMIAKCFDMVQVIRHRLAWDSLADKGRTEPEFRSVSYDEPMQYSELPLPKIEKL